MNYSEIYNKALKYGKAPKEVIANFATQQLANDDLSPNNNSDHIFIDQLLDHADPRHEIVRRDLAMRPTGTYTSKHDAYVDFDKNINKARRAAFGGRARGTDSTLIPQDDGQLSVVHYLHPTTNTVLGHEVTWHPSTGDGRNNITGGYAGYFKPEEYDALMSGLDLPHRSADAVNQETYRQ